MDEMIEPPPRLAKSAGIWRRLSAFCLDGLLLGAFGACIGLVAYDRLVALGGWGRAVGFAIALVYFGAMDSELSGGQTLGKRILGIKVIRADGAPLSVGASTLRATIFCVPYFLNGAFSGEGVITSWLAMVLIFGVGVAIIYLLLFNRRTRQSLHDLAVGAFVVSNKSNDSIGAGSRIGSAHFGAVAAIMAAALDQPRSDRERICAGRAAVKPARVLRPAPGAGRIRRVSPAAQFTFPPTRLAPPMGGSA